MNRVGEGGEERERNIFVYVYQQYLRKAENFLTGAKD
jgi:hypothetical protein